MDPSGHSAENEVGEGQAWRQGDQGWGHCDVQASRSKAGQFGWREGEAAKSHSGGGLERTRWWVDEGDLFGWEEGFKHDGGSVASEALDANVSWGWTARGTGQDLWPKPALHLWPRTPGQRTALQGGSRVGRY